MRDLVTGPDKKSELCYPDRVPWRPAGVLKGLAPPEARGSKRGSIVTIQDRDLSNDTG